MPDVVALGDANIDIVAYFAKFPAKGEDALAIWTEIHCGGSAANTAMALARLGIPTSLVARVGSDSWADYIDRCLRQAGVGCSDLQHDPSAMSGLMYVVVTPDGERTLLGHRGANLFTDPSQIDEGRLAFARLLHLSGYALLGDPQRSAAVRALEIAHRYGIAVTLDPGMALLGQALEEVRTLLPAVSILMPNLAEAQHLTGHTEPETCVQSLLRAGVGAVALKLGREGCLVATDQSWHRVPGFPVEARDSTGAGDSFDAGLIAGFLGDLGWDTAAVLGNALGALAAFRVGAGTADLQAGKVIALLEAHGAAIDRGDLAGSIEQAIAFLVERSATSEEEESS